MTAVLWPRKARPVAKLALVVVLPTPPLPEVTTMIFAMKFVLKMRMQRVLLNAFECVSGMRCGVQRAGQALMGSITSFSPSGPGCRLTMAGLPATSAGKGTSLVR